MRPKRIAVLDADIFVYKVAAAAQRTVMFDEYCISIGDKSEAIVALSNWLHFIQKKLNADDVILCFTGKDNYRKEIWPEYKTHRVTPKPPLMGELIEWCEQSYDCIKEDRLEADDVVADHMSMTYAGASDGIQFIGVSEDKDLLGVPGWLYNPAKDGIAHEVSLEDAIKFFYTQVLTGDSADGYKGVPGVGPVKAAKYIDQAWEESDGVYDFIGKGWEAIVKVYESSYLEEMDAVQNASMAKILWYGDKVDGLGFQTDNIKQYWRKKHGK
jgi:DNA polymerase-1